MTQGQAWGLEALVLGLPLEHKHDDQLSVHYKIMKETFDKTKYKTHIFRNQTDGGDGYLFLT